MTGEGGPFPPAGLAGSPGLRLRENVPLAPRTTLRIGGPARWFAEVSTEPALAAVRRAVLEAGLPLLPLGKGSNLLVPDAGFGGVVLVLVGELAGHRFDGSILAAGGGAPLMGLALASRDAGLSGLEALSGITSTLGGAVRINAGAYGTEIFDLLEEVTTVDAEGRVQARSAGSIERGYRWSGLSGGSEIVSSARLRLVPKARNEIAARLAEVAALRRKALPAEPNAGSVFRNPPGDHAGRLLEACELKGRREGGAEVSLRHANVIVNRGGATAADVRALLGAMKAAVKERFGIDLVPELEEPRSVPARSPSPGPPPFPSPGPRDP